jgi:serine/threonine protein kinase
MQEIFHQYRLVTELAIKYSHSTYLASLDKDPEHQVVLVIFTSSLFPFPQERANLLENAKHIKELQYPYFVPILDMGIEEEQPFVVHEYLPNGSLHSRLKEISPHRLELREALTIVSQVGEALAYAHQHNILHGNLKPENILFDANGQSVLTDFYLLSRKDAIIRDQATEEYAFCYMAPEQFVGICDARSDQYALGCLAYELITGQVPFAEQSFGSIMRRPRDARPAPLSESVPDLPSSLEAAVFKTLAKDPDERFFDFSLFLEMIRSVVLPPSAFPFSHSTNFRIKRAISRPIRLKRPENITSSTIDSTASSSFASQARELFPVVKTTEDEMPETVDDSLIAEAPIPEEAKAVSLAESQESVLPHSFTFFSHPIGLGRPEELASSITNNAVIPSFNPQTLALFPILRIAESEMPEMVDDSLIVEATRPGMPSTITFPGQISPSAAQATQTFWLTNSSIGREVNKLPVKAPVSSVDGQSEDATATMTSSFKMTSSLTGSSGVPSPLTGLIRHGRRKRLGLVLLPLVIITILGTYAAFLPFRTSQPVRVSRPDTTAHPTQVARQVVIPVIRILPTPIPPPTPTVPPTVPVRIIPTPTPIPFLPVSLSSYVNNEGIGSAPGQANLDGSGYAYPADQLPQAGQRTLNGVSYLFPGSAPGANDNVVALGQTINLPHGNYQQAFLLATASWGSVGGMATIRYTDGSTSSASLSAPDWETSSPSGVVRASYRYSSTGIDQSPVYIYAVQITIDRAKIASSLTLPSIAQPSPNQPSLHVFALTLQHA